MTQPQQAFDLGASIQGVLAANPSLGQTPELALGAAQSPDPYGTAEVMSHAANMDAVQQAHDAHAARSSAGSSGFFGTLGHFAHVAVRDTESAIGSGLSAVKNAGSFALTQLSKPLADVQHDYRYIRAVYDRKGPVAGILETLGIAVGGAGGALLGGGPGAVLGADAAASAEQRLFYKQTARDTRTAYTDRNGNDVSFGRDLAHLTDYVANNLSGGAVRVQNTPGRFDAFDAISGLGDAAFDIGADPTLGAGKLKKAVDLVGNARIAGLVGGDATALGRRISTGRLIQPTDTAEDVLRVYQNRPEVRKTFDTLAKMSAGDIATRLPKLAPLARELGAASNENEVAAVFHQAAVVGQYGFSSTGLPKTGITRGLLSRLNAGIYDRLTVPVTVSKAEAAADSSLTAGAVKTTADGAPLEGLNRLGRVYNMFQAYRPFAYDPELDKLSTDSFTSTNPMAYNAIARVMRYSQSPQTVAKVMDKYFAEGSDVATHAAVYKNAVIDMLRAGGLSDTHPILQAMRGSMDEIGVGGENDLYALDKMGLDLSKFERADGSEIKAGMFVNQQGRMTFPNFQAIKNVLRDDSGAAISALGKADQFIAGNYMSKVFKPLALLSLGFAQRVSLAELLPGSLQLGARKVAGLQLLNAGRKLAPEEYARQVESHAAALGDTAAMDTVAAGPLSKSKVQGVVYHGTNSDFTHFDDTAHGDLGWFGPGHYFTEDPKYASTYARQMFPKEGESPQVRMHHIDLRNPFDWEKELSTQDVNSLARKLGVNPSLLHGNGDLVRPARSMQDISAALHVGSDQSLLDDAYGDALQNWEREDARVTESGGVNTWRRPDPANFRAVDEAQFNRAFREWAQQRGHDGVMHRELTDGPYGRSSAAEGARSYVVFNADQIHPPTATQAVSHAEIDSVAAALPGVELADGEHEHVAAAVAKTLYDSVWGKPVLMAGKAQFGKGLMRMSSALLDEDYRRVLMNLTLRRGAHVVSPALMTGDHGLMSDGDAGQKIPLSINHVGASVPGKMQVGDSFQMYKTGDEKHPAMWSAALKEPAGDKGARLMARTILQHEDEHAGQFAAIDAHDRWLEDIRSRTDAEAARYQGLIRVKEYDPATSTYSQDKYNAIMGLVTGEDGTVHKDLLENIAAGRGTDLKTLQKIDLDARPVKVKGPTLNTVSEPDGFDKLVAKGFKPLEAIINHLSREPLYVASVTKEYKFLKPLVDAGTMTEDHAMLLAEQRAVPNMLPLIHNVDLRNQFSDTFRNVMPFYFAQEQAARRYGSVVLSDPAAAAKLLLVHHLIADTGIVRTDPSDPSQRYVVIPGGGPAATWLASAIGATGLVGTQSGIPTQFAGNLQSLKTVVPEGNLPSLSPVISVPLKMIEQRFPESSDVIAPVIGPIAESSTSVWSQIMPSGWLRSFATAAQGSSQSASFTTAYIYAAANAMRQGKLREDMSGPQHDLELARIRNTARIYFLAKGILAGISPLSPKMDVGDLPLRQELTKLIKDKGGFAEGMDAFLKLHPDATPSAVFASESKVGGALPPSTGETTKFLADHGNLVSTYAYAAPFFIPQGAKGNYDATAQNMELSLGLRQRKDIGRFVETVFIAQGASEYFDKEHQYQAALKGLQDAGQTDQASALTQGWQSWAAAFKLAHPTFATDLGSQTGKRTVDGQQAVKEMGTIFDKGLAPENAQTALVKTLYDQYQQYAAAYKQAKAAGDRTTTAALYNGWQAHLDQFAVDNPAAKQVVRTVFARLPRPVPDLEAAQ